MKKFFCLICVCYITFSVFSQNEDALFLSLDSCRNLAIKNNSKSKIADLQLDKIKFEKKAYFAEFFPKISANGMYLLTSATMNYNTRFDLSNTSLPGIIDNLPITIPPQYSGYLDMIYKSIGFDLDITIKPNNTFLVGAQFEQPIFWGGKIITANRMAKMTLQLAEINKNRSNSEIIAKTDEAYWLLVKATNLLEIAKNANEILLFLSKEVDNGIELGMISTNDKMKINSKISESELNIRQAENGIKLASMNLCHTIGINMLSEINPTDTLSENFPNSLSTQQPDVSIRPEFSLLNKQLEIQKQQINLVRADFLPQLGVTGGYNYINGLKLNDEKLFDSGSFMALFSLKIPLFNGLKGYNKINSAKVELKIAEMQTQDNINLLQLEMQKSYNSLDEAFFAIQVQKKETKQAEENFRICKDRHELGFDSMATLLEAQALLYQAQSKFIETKTNFKIAESEYLKVTNGF
ncbi:MAG: TolC family protein, partial [Bacteroidales bacterium]|jgi:outer membrane protein TolC|nr:TolC family protein [Bacteroidales bacterium]